MSWDLDKKSDRIVLAFHMWTNNLFFGLYRKFKTFIGRIGSWYNERKKKHIKRMESHLDHLPNGAGVYHRGSSPPYFIRFRFNNSDDAQEFADALNEVVKQEMRKSRERDKRTGDATE